MRERVADHLARVLRDGDDGAAVAGPPGQQLRVVRVHLRVAPTWRDAAELGGGPRAPRVVGHVDLQLLAPVAVDLGGGDPLPVDVARLHRVLGPVATQERPRVRRVQGPADRRCGTRGRGPAGRAARAPGTSRCRSAGRRRSRPRARGSARTCCRTGRCTTRRWRRRSRRWALRRCSVPVRSSVASGCWGRTWPARCGPGASRGRRRGRGRRGRAPSPPRTCAACRRWSRRPSARTTCWCGFSPLPGSNDSGRVAVPRCSIVKHAPSWMSSRLCTKCDWSSRVADAGGVDERVLEEPCVAAAAERDDVLVVRADEWPDADREERIECGGARAGGAPDVGAGVAGGGGGDRPGPRWRGRSRRWRCRCGRGDAASDVGGRGGGSGHRHRRLRWHGAARVGRRGRVGGPGRRSGAGHGGARGRARRLARGGRRDVVQRDHRGKAAGARPDADREHCRADQPWCGATQAWSPGGGRRRFHLARLRDGSVAWGSGCVRSRRCRTVRSSCSRSAMA